MNGEAKSKNLKAWNFPWLVSFAVVDALALYFLLFPEAMATTSFTQIGVARLALSTLLPVLVLLAAHLLSQNIKATLVFWKINNALSGHEAFSRHGPADQRVDMAALRKHVGALPTEPHEQNSLWYKLYRKVDQAVGVVDSHKSFLLFRDLAAISLLLAVIVPLCLLVVDVRPVAIWSSLSLFLVQYMVAAIAARNNGFRFVGAVLAEHSTRRVTAAPQPNKPKSG